MLVEHVFVTTLDRPLALNVARSYLEELGFARVADPEDGAALHYRRGYDKLGKARKISEQPQNVHVSFDRGRVNVAATIQPQRKANALHQELLVSLVEGLEARLVQGQTTPEARVAWDKVHERIDARALARQRRQRRNLIGCLVVFGIVFLGVIALVLFASLGR